MLRFIFIALAFFLTSRLTAQGIDFFHGTWEEAVEEAKKQEKVIFVDAYASWCGPCKRMAANVFPQTEVGDFYNEHFINVKLDYEKSEAASFRKKYPVSAFPTLYYIDFDGSVVQAVKGMQTVEGFIQLGKTALTKIDRSGNYEKAFENGDRSPDLVLKYIKALNQAGKPSLKIANDYLDEQENLSAPDNLRIILESATEADSRIFDWLIEYRKEIEAITSKEEVSTKIEEACKETVQKSAEFKVEALVIDAKEKMEKYCPEKADKFGIEADIIFYKGTGQPEEYLKACKEYAKKIIDKDANELKRLALDMQNTFPLDKKVQKEAEKIAEKAMKLQGT